ncbi:hypothetical protein T02_12789 [Trichinella nativa]|uniref:Uncharacterized protein n=1 Tax=Trichinella nativa TaxID=6335 RepID=A0A0V1KQF8_9BILA|nr:hypothetical protein T02_12789 [Trichinella nativa]
MVLHHSSSTVIRNVSRSKIPFHADELPFDCVSASGGIIQCGFSDILPRSPIVAPSARFIRDIYDAKSLL